MADESVVNTSRLQDEDEYAYIYRICTMKDVIGTWADVANILNSALGYEYTESKYRKQYQSFQKMFSANQAKLQPDTYEGDIKERIRELERERIKLRTEKLEYSDWLRKHSRDELIAERIANEVRMMPEIVVPAPADHIVTNRRRQEDDVSDNRVGILCYGDEHYGTEFEVKGLHGEIINAYSPEIFERRMHLLLIETVRKVIKNGFTKIKVYSFGDELDGILRVSQLMKLRYGVVESAVRYAEYMSQWLNQLSAYVDVEFHMAEGNHTELRQIGQPKGTFTEDNLSKVIRQIIKIRLEKNNRFTLVENQSGLIFDNVFGINILGIHGEVKNMASALKNFSVMYDTQIDILIGGHKHHYAAETVGIGKDVVSVPSIIGVDSYSMSIGKTSDAGATFIIVEKDLGITEQHYIKFTKN